MPERFPSLQERVVDRTMKTMILQRGILDRYGHISV